MIYKVGQKVDIRRIKANYNDVARPILEQYNYVLTIREVHLCPISDVVDYYFVKEFEKMIWLDHDIIGIYDPIESRFDIIDL